ncbi:MAG: response regulator [Hylemonella sp.]|nr:response regulator [Hylemonella sp.]
MKNIKLLWAEDDPLMHTVIECAFESQRGFDLRLLSSGADALTAANEDPPDLVLLDVFMPLMDGPATLRELRRNPAMRNVPVVFVTAESDVQGMQDLLSLGAIGIISKPIDIVSLPGQVRDFAARHDAAQAGAVDRPRQEPFTDIDGMDQLREEYFDRILECRDDIQKNGKNFLAGNEASAALAAIHFQAHTLAGSAKTFGYASIGDAARELEFATATTPASQPVDRQRVTEKIEAFCACANELAQARSRH